MFFLQQVTSPGTKGLQFNLLQFNLFSWPYSTLLPPVAPVLVFAFVCFIFKTFVSRAQHFLCYSKKSIYLIVCECHSSYIYSNNILFMSTICDEGEGRVGGREGVGGGERI